MSAARPYDGAVDGVGYGTELAGRYRLEERLRTTASSDFWRAVDTTLDRTVGIRLVAPATADDAMDAARRASVVDDPALLRVLDVAQEDGNTGPVTYVVTEFVEATSLADQVRRGGPLPAEQVRSLVGRVARVLAVAAESGVHHEALEPTSVLRTPDGAVKVEGLGVDAAAEGRARAPGDQAARTDAVALVALVYAGLTGHWPLDGEVEGFEPAARVGGAPVAPADVVSGVPNDLDTLCAVTFGHVDDGPLTPAEVVDNLRPWTEDGPVEGDAAVLLGTAPGAGSRPAAERPEMRPAGRFPVRAGAAVVVGAAGAAAAAASTPAPAARTAPPAGDDTAAMSRTELFDDAVARSGVAPAGDDDPPASRHDDQQDQQDQHDDHDDWGDAGGDWETGDWGGDDGYGRVDQEDDERPDRKPTIALAVLAVLVVVGLFLALQAIGGIGGDGGDEVATDPTTSAPAAPGPAPPSESAAPAGPAPQVSGVRTLDPQGGDGENDETAPRAIDDDPDSFWRSSTYSSAEFGGLKDGLGMVVTLSGEAAVSSVRLAVGGSGGAMELRSAPGQGLEGSEVIGTADPASGTVTFELPEPVTTSNLLLWWTELPDADGSFRIELADVTVQ